MSDLCTLAVDAATDRLCLATSCGDRIAFLDLDPARDSTGHVYRHAEHLLNEVGAGFDDLDFVAFGCGPGSFTGVRIAAAVAQALGFALGIPVCRISSLAILAAGARELPSTRMVGTCLDARMGRAYVGLYQVGPGSAVVAVEPDAWVDPGRFVFAGDAPFAAVGSGWMAHPTLLERHRARIVALDSALLPQSRELLSMALHEFREGRGVAPEDALPEYLGQVPAVAAVQMKRQEN